MLIAVYIAQRMELRSQREDLELLNTSVERERIERTFFELIKVHHRIVEGVTFKNANNEELSGRRCFQDIYSQLKEATLLSDHPRPESDTAILPDEEFVEAKFSAYLDHYFRNLFHIVAYVDQSSHQDKKALLKVLRAQLSGSELLLLFYNGLSKYGRDKFYPLIVQYAFLEHLNKKSQFAGSQTREPVSGSGLSRRGIVFFGLLICFGLEAGSVCRLTPIPQSPKKRTPRR